VSETALAAGVAGSQERVASAIPLTYFSNDVHRLSFTADGLEKMMTSKKQSPTTILLVSATIALFCGSLELRAETVRDRLWIWGRPAGIYNNTHFRPLGLRSTVEPVNIVREISERNGASHPFLAAGPTGG